MPKVANPHLIQLELDGHRAKISQSEYELSADEWYRRRTDAFAQLRKMGGVPDEILRLAEGFKEQTLVQLFVHRPAKKVELHVKVKVLDAKDEPAKGQRFAEMIAVGKRLNDDQDKEGMTASEALAFFLRMSLRNLKHAEKSRTAAPVRTLRLIPRSLIAEIAMDLLNSCETWGHPPGSCLNSLIHELLNLEHDRQGMSRDVETQERAAGVVAHAPTVRTRELARALHVNPSTISRWRRSPEFKQMVEQKAKSWKDRAKTDKQLSAFLQEGPIKREALARLLDAIAQLYPPKKIG